MSNQRAFSPILVIVLTAAVVISGYLVYQAQTKTYLPPQTPYSTPPVLREPSPEPIFKSATQYPKKIICDAKNKEFKEFCEFLLEVHPLVTSRNIPGLIDHQELIEVTCKKNPGWDPTICDTASKGERKQGYAYGYIGSDGDVTSKSKLIEILNTRFTKSGPHFYRGSFDRGSIVEIIFMNKQEDSVLILDTEKTDRGWKIRSISMNADSAAPGVVEWYKEPPYGL